MCAPPQRVVAPCAPPSWHPSSGRTRTRRCQRNAHQSGTRRASPASRQRCRSPLGPAPLDRGRPPRPQERPRSTVDSSRACPDLSNQHHTSTQHATPPRPPHGPHGPDGPSQRRVPLMQASLLHPQPLPPALRRGRAQRRVLWGVRVARAHRRRATRGSPRRTGRPGVRRTPQSTDLRLGATAVPLPRRGSLATAAGCIPGQQPPPLGRETPAAIRRKLPPASRRGRPRSAYHLHTDALPGDAQAAKAQTGSVGACERQRGTYLTYLDTYLQPPHLHPYVHPAPRAVGTRCPAQRPRSLAVTPQLLAPAPLRPPPADSETTCYAGQPQSQQWRRRQAQLAAGPAAGRRPAPQRSAEVPPPSSESKSFVSTWAHAF